MSSHVSTESFWDFSVRIYAAEGVAEACLALQNDHGADVNMLLYCCWIGRRIGRFDDALFSRATGFSTDWADHVVKPLRGTRTWMKSTGCVQEPVPAAQCMALREEIKAVELSCEKMQQQVLESMTDAILPRRVESERQLQDVASNLLRYTDHAGIPAANVVRRQFAVLIHAAYPEFDRKSIDRALA